jgi:hypothetical protein
VEGRASDEPAARGEGWKCSGASWSCRQIEESYKADGLFHYMKRCDYCGKEYGDNASICAIDSQPLVEVGYCGPTPSVLPPPEVPPLLRADPGGAPPVIGGFSDLERQVLAGGRFVVFQYCFSVLVLTFKRSSVIVYVPPGEDGAGPAISNSMISLLAGWWGIPWGPIFTISTIFRNLRGGIDVTSAVLAEKVGAGRAAQVMAERRVIPARSRRLKLLGWGLAGMGSLLALSIVLPFAIALFFMVVSPGEASKEASTHPLPAGQSEFQSANHQIGVNHGTVGFGNSSKAVAVATQFSTDMAKLRGVFFEGGKKDGLSVSGHEFLAYCELHDSECVIIAHVPELRRFNAEAKASLGNLAWGTAQSALRKQGAAKPAMKLAVGLRGIALYDRVLTGTVVLDPESPDTGLTETITEARPERSLYPFFQTPAVQLPDPAK